ncbi:hypothetical protein BB734_09900 [Mycobacterium avium subsp. hominissuis]|uniref:Recombination endonuclease VII n=2 Tax=Mycobacterium avium TaxID=1764 RepID=A0A2A2ZCP3_MYCAV|nr:hypothetical protein [Mycobacterium avium subsp. hominissuis]PBA24239.1 hypothetical protein CKJ66_24045 [Mycobacterium avium]MCA4741373.1 hypothetical protein [Mycobacterium avium subsp. hominissuis]MCA4746192.1 hypothetical protein [Mycobacterium avium subsp. hominissuis]PBA39356.1 hypothetical protein CKJ63_22465 [Mycobacterium avium]
MNKNTERSRRYRERHANDLAYQERRRQSRKTSEFVERRWRRRGSNATVEGFKSFFDAQSGRCALCRIVFEHTPDFDHCHVCEDPRGLLCNPCNRILGLYERRGMRRRVWNEDDVVAYLETCSCYIDYD